MDFTPSKTLAVDIGEFEASPDEVEEEYVEQKRHASSYPRTPTRLTKYDPNAIVDSPSTPVRPFSAPIWPVFPLGSPIEPSGLGDLEFDALDWDALENIARKFDENELHTFNSIFYRQILSQLGLEGRQKWLELLLHLGVQHETLWADRLHNFQEDYLVKEAKRTAKRKSALAVQQIALVSKSIWFQRWYNAGILKAQLDQLLKAPMGRIFGLWRNKAQLLRKNLADAESVFCTSQNKRLIAQWRNKLKQVRDLDEKSSSFNYNRLAKMAIQVIKTSMFKQADVSQSFQVENTRKAFSKWRRKFQEVKSKERFESEQKTIYLKSWHDNLEQFRSQLEKADRYQKDQVVHWYRVWSNKLEQMYTLYASGEVVFETNLKSAVFQQWRHDAKLLSVGAPFLYLSQQRIKQNVLNEWRALASIQRESDRFRRFFAVQNALKIWRLEARCRLLESTVNASSCQRAFRQWRRNARLETVKKTKQLQNSRQMLEFWRDETRNVQRREHALDLRARLLRKRFEFAEFWRIVQLKYSEQEHELSVAETYYNEQLQAKVFNELSKVAVTRIENEVNAGAYALEILKKRYFEVWKQAFKQVHEEQFKQLEVYAEATHAMSLLRWTFSQWRQKVNKISQAEQFSDMILYERYFRIWLEKLADHQEQLARAGDWYIESSRVITFGKWQDRLDQVRQNELELELLQGGRAIEKTATVFEQWRAATMLVKDKDPLLARRSEWFSQQQARRIFRKWRRSTERSQPSPQTPLRSEALLQRSTVSRMLSQRRPLGRVHSSGSPISRRGADTLI